MHFNYRNTRQAPIPDELQIKPTRLSIIEPTIHQNIGLFLALKQDFGVGSSLFKRSSKSEIQLHRIAAIGIILSFIGIF